MATQQDGQERLANGLGWFSIGLGLAEVIAPGKLAQFIGMPDKSSTRNLLRAYGAREIAAGVGILTQAQPAGWMWGRVAGDMLDLGTLATTALKSDGVNRTRIAAATAAVAGVTALDVFCGQRLSQQSNGSSGGSVHVTKTLILNVTPEQAYSYWHNFENFPNFMEHLESVQVTGGNRSHWKAKAPLGMTVEWDAEMTEDQPNRRIAWRSVEGSEIPNAGTVSFERAIGNRGTLLRVELQYDPPGGKLGALFAKLFGEEPNMQLYGDLRRFRQILELGEVVKSDSSIHSGMHAARPSVAEA